MNKPKKPTFIASPYMLYEQTLNHRIILSDKPIMHYKAFGFVFISVYDTLEEACVEAEQFKEEAEDEDGETWSFEEI